MEHRSKMMLYMFFLLVYFIRGQAKGCLQQEREALVDLKAATREVQGLIIEDVAHNNKSDVWFKWDSEASDCCKWQGVNCDQHSGRVTQLRMPTCEGTSKLNSAQLLPVHCYYICSSLPPSLSRLEALEVLDLRGGCLGGDIPLHIFTPLTNLTHLDLSNNFFYPAHLPLLPKLTYLNFSAPPIILPPGHAGFNLSNLARSLPNLRYLDLSVSLPFDLPPFLSLLQDLFPILDLLTELLEPIRGPIPSEFSASFLPHLAYLDLRGNGLQGVIPEQLGTLQSLAYLNLAGNRFRNPLPWPSLASLSQLTHLELGNIDGDILVWEARQAQWQCKWKALEFLSCRNMRFALNDSAPFCLEQPEIMSKLKTLSFSAHYGSIGPLLHSLSLVNASLSLQALFLPGTSLGEFQGQHPPAWLHPLDTPFLESLDVSDNTLTSLPTWLPQHPLLERLDISDNCLLEFPSSLRQLQFLKTLDISSNCLNVSLHQLELHKYTKLESLILYQNAITGSIPLSLLQPSLSVLDLSDNLLSGGIPFSIGNLTSLSYLDLSQNNLIRAIPLSMGSMSKLSYLSLSYNMLSGVVPASMSNLTALKDLELSHNYLKGFIPLFMFRLKLSTLDLSNNMLVGSLPQIWQNCAVLKILDLSSNNLSGSLPHLFRECPTLSSISLSNNSLSGTLPQTYLNCELLGKLDLSSNNLYGALPEGMFINCSHLFFVKLGQNSLSLEIPTSVANLELIEVLILDNNMLSGEIPMGLQNCSFLMVLDLSHNKLSGSIPRWITGTNFPYLSILMLSNNHFQGPIPWSLVGNLTSLQILGLANNNLSGSIPTYLDHLVGMASYEGEHVTNITILYTATLTIPMKGIDQLLSEYILSATVALDLSNNLLQGPIPPQIGALRGLTILNLSHNALSGHIPSTLGGLSRALESLDLSDNQLTGGIPSEFCSLDFLAALNVSSNHLQGVIPACPHLSTFDASSFAHNDGLCGSSLPDQCATAPSAQKAPQEEAHLTWFDKLQEVVALGGVGIGYAIGLVLMSLFLYFRA